MIGFQRAKTKGQTSKHFDKEILEDLNPIVNIQYIPAARKTICIRVVSESQILVRFPAGKETEARGFVVKKSSWIQKSAEMQRQKQLKGQDFNLKELEFAKYRSYAHEVLGARLDLISKNIGLKYAAFKLSKAKTSWGVCTGHNHIRLHWKLIFLAQEIQDYVIIHELCHTLQKNHQLRFWNLVAKFCPDFKDCKKTLKLASFLLA